MSSVLDEIRGRRSVTVEQMLLSLEMVPASDTETKRSLLSIASRGLGDARVAARWIELAAAETDTSLREAMVARLMPLDFRQIPDLAAYVRLLVDCVAQDNIKPMALACLGRIVVANPEVTAALIEAYRQQRQADAQRLILQAFAQNEDLPAPLVEFFLSVVDQVDADLKTLIVDRLLRKDALQGEALAKLLRPAEPVAVRLMTLSYLIERSVALEEVTTTVLLSDPDAGCRISAVQALAARGVSSGPAFDAMLQALRADPESGVREAAMRAFEHSLAMTPPVIDALVAALQSEKNAANVQFLLRILTPHVGRSDAVKAGLKALLTGTLRAELAIVIYDTLGRLVAWDEGFLETFLAAYDAEQHDGVRAAILRALSSRADPDDRLVKFHQAALKAPDPRLKTWGARGLLMIAMDESKTAAVAAGADILLDRLEDEGIKEALATKIARIPDKSPALVATLKRVADQATDGNLKKICQEAYDKAAAAEGADAIDWEQWYRRVEVEKSVEGVFPDLFLHYDSNPAAARRILRAALAPDCTSCYKAGISDGTIIGFLIVKNAIDDDISRYCVNFILTQESNYGNPNFYLATLKMNPGFPAMMESLWQILDKRSDVNPVLMRELLLMVHQSDEQVGKRVRERLLSKTNCKAALPYLNFIAGNLAWPEAPPILLDAITKPALIDPDNRGLIEEALRNIGRDPATELTKKVEGPGLADE